MNREQQLAYIQENHQELYAILERNVPEYLEDCQNADPVTVRLYNWYIWAYFLPDCTKILAS